MARKSKKVEGKMNISNMKITDGKDHLCKNAAIKSLEQIWGFSMSKYKTHKEKEYAHMLESMNKVDLQKECIKHDLMPKDSRELMTNRLMTEFKKYIATLNTRDIKPHVLKVSDKARDILSKGSNQLVYR